MRMLGLVQSVPYVISDWQTLNQCYYILVIQYFPPQKCPSQILTHQDTYPPFGHPAGIPLATSCEVPEIIKL